MEKNGIKMVLVKRSKIVLTCCAFSIVFLFSTTGLISSLTYLFISILGILSIILIWQAIHLWKPQRKNIQAGLFLCFIILTDYWLLILFSKYNGYSSYIILFCTEALRLWALITFFCGFDNAKNIRKAWAIFLGKFLIFELIGFLFSALGTSQVGKGILQAFGIFHPLLLIPLSISFFIQLYATAWYVLKYYDGLKQEA